MDIPKCTVISREDIENLHFSIPFIQKAIQGDKPRLFSLADQVTVRYPDRKWDTIISDASRGILVGNFLTRVLLNSGFDLHNLEPTHLPIANSRHAAKNRATRKVHGASVKAYLLEHGVQNALVVTDTVDSGKSIQRLGGNIRGAGIRLDCAVLVSSHSQNSLRRKIHLAKYSELYATTPTNWEALTAGAELYQGIGVETVVGMAEPQPAQYAWPLVGLAAIQAYDTLADEYVLQAQSS